MRVAPSLIFVSVLSVSLGRAHAQDASGRPSPLVLSKSVEGFGPDAQLTGGIGLGFEAKLENFFLARARLGALYALQPWIVNLGFTAEVGAMAGLGWGGELELSHSGTFFGTAGIARVDEQRWLAHLGLGFTIFGLEWQHVFEGSKPHNALLVEVRLPLGLWWLHKRQEKAEAETASASRPAPQIVQPPTSNPPPLVLGEPPREPAKATAAPAAMSGSAPRADVAARETELAERLHDAENARERGDHLAEALALSRAYAVKPEPDILLQLVAAELALGKPRSALADWQRLPDPQKQSARANELREQIAANISQLRINLSGTTSEQAVVSIDGVVEPTANRGYDLPLDPGAHKLQVMRAKRVLVERDFVAEPGKLQRLDLELPNE